MGTLAAGTSITLTLDAGAVLDITGSAELNFGSGRIESCSGFGRYGTYSTSVSVLVSAVSNVIYQEYNLETGGQSFDTTSSGGKIEGIKNKDGSIVPIINLKQTVLQSASSGTSSDWLPIAAFPERLAYSLDSGSTSTTFTIGISADGGTTTLAQAFTGSWASSSVAEITYPIQYSDITATHFKITVTAGGPITFIRGV